MTNKDQQAPEPVVIKVYDVSDDTKGIAVKDSNGDVTIVTITKK